MIDVSFCSATPHLVTCVYSASSVDSDSLSMFNLVCVWSVMDGTKPMRVLVSDAEITCAAMLPAAVVAGTSAGSALLWDLREPLTMHRNTFPDMGSCSWDGVIRRPTYCTDTLGEESHELPVLRVRLTSQQEGELEDNDGMLSRRF